jgi:hypothetical protein
VLLSWAWLLGILVAQHPAGGGSHASEDPSPRVPAAVRTACDTAYTIAAGTPGVSIQRSTGLLSDEALRHPVLGCRLIISGSFARTEDGRDASVLLREGFTARGWLEMADYAADGKDGTQFGFRKEATACLCRGDWNGGADGEPEIPPEDWYKVSVLCTSPVPLKRNRH